MLNRLSCGVLLVLIVAALPWQVNAQSAPLAYAAAETAGRIKFEVRVENPHVKFGQDFNVRVKVINRSRKPIYLVKKKENDITVQDNERRIEVSPPFPFPLNHGDFDFKFTKVGAGRIAYDVITVPGSLATREGTWLITVGVGFVEDISDLVPLPPERSDPAPWRALLYERMSSVSVGRLTVRFTKE